MEKERTKAGAQCCPNFCWDVTTQTWTCMEGASAHVDGTFTAEKGVMLLMLKKITTRRRSDMPKAALALLVEAGVDLNECLIVEVLQEGLLRP